MIAQLRLDERLIHGQIVTNWSRALDVNMIVVANDAVAADKMRQQALLMTAPAGKKVNIRSLDATIKALQDPRAASVRMLVIVNTPADALKLTEALQIKDVNIANYTHKEREGITSLTSYVYVNDEEIAILKKLCEVGENVFSQMIPSTPRYELRDLLKGK